jgi:hypothetical protein
LSRKMLSRWWAWSGKGVIILNKNKLLIKKWYAVRNSKGFIVRSPAVTLSKLFQLWAIVVSFLKWKWHSLPHYKAVRIK